MSTRFFPPDQRGVALPMAMLALLILSTLMIAFSVLAASEPTIANNQLMVAQARSLAEAGVEHAIWALMNPTDAKGIPTAGAISAPYDGSRLVTMSRGGSEVGGFRVTVTTGQAGCPSAAERCIVAVGWVPNDSTGAPKAHQKIAVTAGNPQLLFKDPPAALVAHGDLQASGNSLVDSRSDASCGQKIGAVVTGRTVLSGSSGIYGAADGNDTPNEVASANGGPILASADVVTDVAASALDRYTWTDDEINFLRAYAKAHGTYLQGAVSFSSSNRIANGLVFVDTTSGKNITREGVAPATADSDFARVDIAGADAAADPSGVFRGWLFVNGGLSVSGDFRMNGLAYAQNEISYRGSGSSVISGAVISRNVRDASSTRIDSEPLGNASITFHCAFAKTGGSFLPDTWTIIPGTYRELCDSCSS